MVDLGKSIYLQPTFSAPVLFLGGLLFGYGMVLSNGCGSRALVLLGRGNLRSLRRRDRARHRRADDAQGPDRAGAHRAGSGLANHGQRQFAAVTVGDAWPRLKPCRARMIAAAAIVVALILFAFAHPPFRRSPGQIAAGVIVGLLVAGGWYVTGYLGADDFNPVPVTSLTFIAPIADSLQYAMLSTGRRSISASPPLPACSPAAWSPRSLRAASISKAIRRRATCCARPAAPR